MVWTWLWCVRSQLDQPVTQQDTKKGQKWDKMESWPHFGPPQRLTTPKPYGADPIGSGMVWTRAVARPIPTGPTNDPTGHKEGTEVGQNGVTATFRSTATTHNPKTLWGRSYRIKDGTGPEVWCPIPTGPTYDPTGHKKGTEVGQNGLTAPFRSTATTHRPPQETLQGHPYRVLIGTL